MFDAFLRHYRGNVLTEVLQEFTSLVRGVPGSATAAQTALTENELDTEVVEAVRMSKLIGGTVEQARSAARGDRALVSNRELTEEERDAKRISEITSRGVTQSW